jgi:hypothetical protein
MRVEEIELEVASVVVICNISAMKIIICRGCYTETADRSPMDYSPPHIP